MTAKRAAYLGPAKRRPLVLDAALEIFADGGFSDASMAAIAKRAAITKPVLYDCFPGGKQEIFLALLDREEERFLDHMWGVLSAARRMALGEGLQAGISAFLDYADLNPNAFRMIFGSAGTADPALQERLEVVRERVVRMMTDEAVDVGGSGAPASVMEIFTRSIVAMCEGIARWWVRDKPFERDVLVAAIVGWMMKGFEGILPPDVLTASPPDALRSAPLPEPRP